MPRLTGLWSHSDFLILWVAQTLAALNAQVTYLTLSLIAALTLHASSFEMGLLSTVATLPNLLIGLFAGAWVDRTRRRPTLIVANVTRALLLVSIPVASAFSVLTIWQLYAVLFLFGIGTTIFEVAHFSLLPSLVGRSQMLEANSRTVASMSVAGAAGPGLAGGLVQLLTAPIALLVNAVSLIWSASLIYTIRLQEPSPTPSSNRHIWAEIADGLRPLYRDSLLRSIVGSSMIYLLFNNIMVAVYVLYTARDLAITPLTLGLIFGFGGAGAVLGAMFATRVTDRLGFGPTMIVVNLIGGIFLLLIPLAGSLPAAAVVLGIAQCVSQMMGAIFYINQTSLRQVVTPDHLLGRMNASYRFLTMGMIPIGSLLGGMLGQTIGLYATLVVGALGTLLPVLWLMFSPVRTLYTIESLPELTLTPTGEKPL